MKNALKEMIIFVVLCLVVVIILAIMFYNFNPSGKVVPSKVTYAAPSTVKEELQDAADASQTTIKMEDKVYTIDGTDLNVYQKNKSYNSGNSNPFSNPARSTNENTSNTTTNVSTNGNGSSGSTTSTSNNSPAAMNQTEINANIGNGSSSGTTTNTQPSKIK